MNILKNELIQILNLEKKSNGFLIISEPPSSRLSNYSTGSSNISEKQKKSNLETIKCRIEEFAREGRSMWSVAAAAFIADNPMEGLAKRSVEVADIYLTYFERREIAKLIVKRYDDTFSFHCDPMVPRIDQILINESSLVRASAVNGSNNNGEPILNVITSDINYSSNSPTIATHCNEDNCIYAPYQCVNQECQVVISRKWSQNHDGVCTCKIVPCVRECGQSVMRKMMHIHMNSSCDLKPVTCPFHELGCIAGIIVIV
jgi:hypothetical protein